MAVTLHTNFGDLKIEVFCDTTPRTAENFLALCASEYYTGTKFHRNLRGFMIQGGDPTETGKGGESVWGGFFEDEFHPHNTHNQRGILAMANKNRADTNGSQFYITYAKQPHLNSKHTVFGKLIDGFETLDALERVQVGQKDRPIQDIVIENVTIHANPIADMS